MVKFYFCFGPYYAPFCMYYTIALFFVIILSLKLSFSPRLFVVILIRLVSMNFWRCPIGLGILNIQHAKILLGFQL